MTRPLVIGLGSPHGDDRAGWAIVDRLEAQGDTRARRVCDGVELLAALEGQDDVVIVDASAPVDTPGRVRVFVWPCPELAGMRAWSTHGLGLVDALRLAEALGQLPKRTTIVAIEGETARAGAPLSEAVARTVSDLADQHVAAGKIESRTHE